jgi:Phage P22-like portal protein
VAEDAKKPVSTDDDTLKDDREAFEQARDAENHNRVAYEDDVRFARLEDQWPADIKALRERDHRPCLTINKLRAFIAQVVNDARQNKPSISVHPVDNGADKKTASIYSGLIRNIEYVSNADTAYDWAADCAISGGFGYLRIGLDYACDDSFDLDLEIKRVLDPLSVYGDPHGTSADGSDWNSAFVVETLSEDEFARKYKGASKVDWDALGYTSLGDEWFREKTVRVAERWIRDEIDRPIVLLTDAMGQDPIIVPKKQMENEFFRVQMEASGRQVVRERTAKAYRVKQRIISGCEVLKEEEWAGKYIPIVPVYGEEVFIDGKRHFRSLIRSAKDAQRQYNYWETNATELVALAPRVPFIGKKGTFKSDPNWHTANLENHAFLEYDGEMPQRQPLDMGAAAGSITQAARASDNIKSVLGMFDASLGAQSNETSGKAILARQREGDVGSFHFADNMVRAIRHTGRILIDLIPHVYGKDRIIRTIGEDGTQETVPLGKPVPEKDRDGKPVMGQDGSPTIRIYDLSVGKYDLTVKAGPGYTTKREEAATQMTAMVQAMPAMAPYVMDILAKNLDWPGAEELHERFKNMVPPEAQGQGNGIPPQIQQGIEQMQQAGAQLERENEQLKADKSLEARKLDLEDEKLSIERMKVEHEINTVQAETDLATNADAQQQMSLDLLSEISSKVDASLAYATAPRSIVRDETGQAVGVQIGNMVKPVYRDASGQVAGLQ